MKQGTIVTPNDAPTWVSQLISNIMGWVQQLRRGPQPLTSYATTALPDATKFTNSIIALTNGATNKRIAVSDGTIWRYPDGNAV